MRTCFSARFVAYLGDQINIRALSKSDFACREAKELYFSCQRMMKHSFHVFFTLFSLGHKNLSLVSYKPNLHHQCKICMVGQKQGSQYKITGFIFFFLGSLKCSINVSLSCALVFKTLEHIQLSFP